MNRNQLLEACDELNIKIKINPDNILQIKGDYEAYSQIENINGIWEYSVINFERRTPPKKTNVKVFSDEESAITHFFINVLKEAYFYEVFPPNNPAHDVKSTQELKDLFDDIGIKERLYSFRDVEPQQIYGEMDKNQTLIISYINENKQKQFTTMPLPLERGFFVMYRLTHFLHILKMVEEKLKEDNILNTSFNDQDIETFIK
ncbi:hypothetical protein P4361_01615 [Fictibacillus sp. B-59209]|uniref:hypothetical protein n=1 Tax=Fictibacillus sp. B-59209 TaxID=3024873 RepID=UPI002E21C782|nr:hypothetical protein [Fictibacillus sp. B-59209]